MSYPIIMLSNGLRVANFSSPHPFTFEDGSILPAIPNSSFDLDCHESEIDDHTIMVKFCTTPLVRANLLDWYYVYNEGLVDIVIVPRPLLDALYDENHIWASNDMPTIQYLLKSPFRTIRLVDREKKICSINKFCI